MEVSNTSENDKEKILRKDPYGSETVFLARKRPPNSLCLLDWMEQAGLVGAVLISL